MEWGRLESYRGIGFAKVALDEQGTIIDCTSAFAMALGRDRIGVLGRSDIELTAPKYRATTKVRMEAARESGEVHIASEKAYLLPSGSHVWCSVEAVKFDREHLLMAIWRVVCATSSIELEQARRERDEIASTLESVREKMYQLMLAVANQQPSFQVVGGISGGQNNVGDNKVRDQNQRGEANEQ